MLPCQATAGEGLVTGVFVAPHSSDDTVGELAFVGTSGISGVLPSAFLRVR